MAADCLSSSPTPDLPPLDHLIRRLSLISLGLLGSSPNFPQFGSVTTRRPRPLRTPQLSAVGLASLLLGVSSTLMLFGSFAFMVGFMLMPLFMVVMFVVCVGSVLASFRAPGIGFGAWGGNVLRAKRGFES